jgi:hypothetical protein
MGHRPGVSDRLALYRSQHAELLAVAGALEALLGFDAPRPGAARDVLARLAGKLTVHLRMEDQGLYPELLASQDEAVRETARAFQAEMGGLREGADALLRRWLGPGVIDRAPAAFAAEARPILGALARRIAAEDTQLYPLAERTG